MTSSPASSLQSSTDRALAERIDAVLSRQLDTQRLVGAGGLTATAGEFGITGISTATGIGPSFGLAVSAAGAYATVNYTASAAATVASAAKLTSGGDMTVASTDYVNAAGQAGVFSAGCKAPFTTE